jgi:nucleoside-diphosphate-sugar epimerase
MRILVTGVTGRIGANLAAALIRVGHEVRGLVWPGDARVRKLSGLGIELVSGTITEVRDVRTALDGMDAVYHLGAAFQGGGPFSVSDYFETNVRGTFNMLEAAGTTDGLRQFLFASTDAVYDKYVLGGQQEPIREDVTPRQPHGWYALSKSVGEELCNAYSRNGTMPATVLRFCYVAGAGEILDYRQFYLSAFKDRPELASVWQGEERLVVLSDLAGRPYKKHIADVRDIVHGCVCALDNPAALGQTFQLAGPKPFTWAEAVPHLSRVLGMPYVEAALDGAPTFYEFDISKPRELLGFDPQYDIIRMLDDAAAFRRGDRTDVLPTG